MNERSTMISKLIEDHETRESYIRSKLSVLIPSQIKSMRLRRGLTQSELGVKTGMKQARISALEHIGDASFSLSTLIRIASAFKIGLQVRFVTMSELLAWENSFEPDSFDVVPIQEDDSFLDQRLVAESHGVRLGHSLAYFSQKDIPKMASNEEPSFWNEERLLGSHSAHFNALQASQSNKQGHAA